MLREDKVGVKFLAAVVVGRSVFAVDRVPGERGSLASVLLVHPGETGVRFNRPAIGADVDDALAVVASGRSINANAVVR